MREPELIKSFYLKIFTIADYECNSHMIIYSCPGVPQLCGWFRKVVNAA